MKVVLTGTPGTGKSTVAPDMADELDLTPIEVGEYARNHGYVTRYDQERDTREIDLDGLSKDLKEKEDVLFVGHTAQYLEADHAVVLRCAPPELRKRLSDRGYGEEKVEENVDSEVLDVVTAETMNLQNRVYEIDTTDLSPEDVVEEACDAASNCLERTGTVDWSEFMEEGL
ncbi:MAG: adenylate kinase family protein [Halobacteria archaeon]